MGGQILIELTGNDYKKFYLNITVIETIHPLLRGGSEIFLTTGRSVVCSESIETLVKILKEVLE